MPRKLDAAISLRSSENLDAGSTFGCGRRRRRGRDHTDDAGGRRGHRKGRGCAAGKQRRCARDGVEKPLAQATTGSRVRVSKVHGDCRFRSKMISMGILPGAPVTVLEAGTDRRPLLIAVDGGRLCLDSQCSRQITVRES